MEKAHVPQPVYRQARFTDLDALAALEAEVFAEPYLFLMLRQLYDLHGSEWLVAELDGTVIGYALTLEQNGRALLFTFAVVERLRFRGYGCALLERALERCASIGAEVMYLTVRPDNYQASNLFKRAGFVLAGHDDEYFGPGHPRDVFEYHLHPAGATRPPHALRRPGLHNGFPPEGITTVVGWRPGSVPAPRIE